MRIVAGLGVMWWTACRQGPTMRLRKLLAVLCVLTLLSAPTTSQQPFTITPPTLAAWPSERAGLSVMTYNIKGLPWPIARGRPRALDAIGQRLRLMRQREVQPDVVLLQEAFSDDAKRIAEIAGYDFVARGPSASRVQPLPPLGEGFAGDARWIKGERSGNVVDSGLLILSDFPIVKSRRYAFPRGACAGYDCLASKGVLAAWIKLPSLRSPIAVVDTHLNSRHSTHVAPARADAAYAWQVGAVHRFLKRAIPLETPVIFGGDFNIGDVDRRMQAFDATPLLGSHQTDDLRAVSRSEAVVPGDKEEALQIVERNKDRIFSRGGPDIALEPQRAWVPFAEEPSGGAMSDHFGFVIDYKLSNNEEARS